MRAIGITLIELAVSVGIIIIFFVLLATSLIYFYRFPTFDIFRDASTYRTIFFELSKTLKEADEIKNIYNTSAVSAIYVQVENSIYAYRINRTLSNRRLEKSMDRGYNWFFVPNTSNLQDIVFKAPTPYSQAKIVFVSLKTNHPNSKISKFHQFAVKIRKEKEFRFVISGIVNSTNNPNNNRVQYSIGYGSNWQNFSNISNRISLRTLNIDNFIASYNSVQSVRTSTDNYQLWHFYNQNYSSNFRYTYLDTSASFVRVVNTSPGADNDWLKIVSVGDYLYTAYAVQETLYTPSTGLWEQYYSVYFAYKKLVPNYWQNGIRNPWLKSRVFSIRREAIGNGTIRFVRFCYGYVGNTSNARRFHITFCAGVQGVQPSINDFYYLGSNDGKNWEVINVDDDKIAQNSIDNLNPLFVVPLVGSIPDIDANKNQLHFVFVNWISTVGMNRFAVAYLYTENLETFSNIQYLNSNNPYYRDPNRSNPDNISPFACQVLNDFDAIFFSNSIYVILSGLFRSQVWNNIPSYKIVLLCKESFSSPAVYNVHPDGNGSISFPSVSLAIGNKYVHIVASSGNRIYYIRRPLSEAFMYDFYENSFQAFAARSIDSVHSGNYLHVSFYNPNTRDLDYCRISLAPSFQRISVDDNLAMGQSCIGGEPLLGFNNIPVEFVTNGVMSGISMGSDNYLYFLTYSSSSSSLGEVVYTAPNSNAFPDNYGFDTFLVHDSSSYCRSINCDVDSNGNFVVVYTDNSGSETSVPAAGHINDLKIYARGFHTEIDGNRRFDTENAHGVKWSMSSGFHNDVKIVNNVIYVAYFRLDSSNVLFLNLARSNDRGETWFFEEDLSKTVAISNHQNSNDISLQVRGNIINIAYRYQDGYLGIAKKENNYWNKYTPSIISQREFNIRTFLDKSNNLHILSFGNTERPYKEVYYRVFDNDTNTFLIFDGIDVVNLWEEYLDHGIELMGPAGDILVEDDDTVYIVVSTLRNNTYGVDLLINKDGVWQPPIRIPPSSPIHYLLNSLRINKW